MTEQWENSKEFIAARKRWWRWMFQQPAPIQAVSSFVESWECLDAREAFLKRIRKKRK